VKDKVHIIEIERFTKIVVVVVVVVYLHDNSNIQMRIQKKKIKIMQTRSSKKLETYKQRTLIAV